MPVHVYLVRFQEKPSSWKSWNESLWKVSNSSSRDCTGSSILVPLSNRCKVLVTCLWGDCVVTYSLCWANPSLHDSWSSTGAWLGPMKCRGAPLHGCLCNLMSLHMWCNQTRVRPPHRSPRTHLISLQGVNVVGRILRGWKWHKQLHENTSNFKLNSSELLSANLWIHLNSYLSESQVNCSVLQKRLRNPNILHDKSD